MGLGGRGDALDVIEFELELLFHGLAFQRWIPM
jgi:hypothetical protein